MKKFIFAVCIVTVLICCLVLATGCEWKTVEGDLWLNSCDIVASVNDTGDLTVSETWKVETDSEEGYRNLYKTIDLYDSAFNSVDTFEWISVTVDGQTFRYDDSIYEINENVLSNKHGKYYMYKTGGNTYEFGIITDSFYDEKTVTFQYRLKNFVGGYTDIAEFYWKIYSEEFEMYIVDLNMKVTFPDTVDFSDELATYAFLHCVEESNLSLDKNVLTVEGHDISAGTQVEIHSLLPREDFTLSKTVPTAGKETLLAQEETWLQEWEEAQRVAQIVAYVDVYGSIALVVLALLYIVISYVKGPYKIKDVSYVREIPKEWRPASMGHFYYYYKRNGARKNQNALISATILDLARRNYLDILPDEQEDYRLDVKNVSDAQKGELKEYEQQIYSLLKSVQEFYNAPFSMKELEKYTKKHAESTYRRMQYFFEMSESELKKYKGDKNKLRASILIPGILVVGGIILEVTAILSVEFLPFVMIASGIAMLFGQYPITKLSDEGNKKYEEIVGLKNFLSDFSNLKDYDIPQLVLWEEYLVYATMMGISEKVLKNLKMKYPEMLEKQYDSSYYRRGYIYTYMYLAHHHGPRGMGFDMGGHVQQAMRNIQNAARAGAPSANGHGGGGFSGGGGGHGGGGGGGRH